MYKKYDIIFVDLNPRKGHTQAGVRPCVIVQNNLFNTAAPTVIVIPLTTVLKNPFPSEFIIKKSNKNGLSEDSRFLGSQIITIDKEYITKKIGVLESDYHGELKNALSITLDFEDNF
ncbi:MAG: type II toxin-antitoxin system PemK/MazF family toxin [Candidatus Gracilibacteria bacterium]|nr:type II toxin-antitoxin system PemK/MazF family toxin [Candidatus Gracilibacteria bacterium]